MPDDRWKMLARVADGRLLLARAPDAPPAIEVPWSGPPDAAYADLTRLTDWQVHPYTSSCVLRITVHAADDRVLGEMDHEVWD